jgi:hypothetical protein
MYSPLIRDTICGHRIVKVPHPVRSAKSSTISPSQYCGGGPRGNPGCCSSFLLLSHDSLSCFLLHTAEAGDNHAFDDVDAQLLLLLSSF